jgi:putative transposase
LNLSLLHVETRASYPLITEQLVREEVKESAPKAVKGKRAKRGRPKGSANKNRKDVGLSPFQTQLQGCIRAALKLIGVDLDVVYFVYDGALGNNAGLQTVTQTGLHLISKLRHDSSFTSPTPGDIRAKAGGANMAKG